MYGPIMTLHITRVSEETFLTVSAIPFASDNTPGIVTFSTRLRFGLVMSHTGGGVDVSERDNLVLLGLELCLKVCERDGITERCPELVHVCAIGSETKQDIDDYCRCTDGRTTQRTNPRSCRRSSRCSGRARSRRARQGWQRPSRRTGVRRTLDTASRQGGHGRGNAKS